MNIEDRLKGLLAEMDRNLATPAEWWIPREDYENLRKEYPHLPEVVGDGPVVHVDENGAHGE